VPADHPYPGKPLKLGSKGKAVEQLQRELELKVDGKFGPRTALSVERFQRNRKLGTDGIVDKVIWHATFGLPEPELHPQTPETRMDRLRRFRVEILQRSRQLRRLRPGRRRRKVKVRRRRLIEGARRIVRRNARPSVVGRNKVRGGTPGERVRFAAQEALRRYNRDERPSFYSQDGAYTVDYALTGEPFGYRSDCSQWVASLFKCCGLPDPNRLGYTGGYTGSLAANGEEITAEQAARERDRPVLIIWDPWGDSGHVEVPVGGNRTIGHGSPPIAAHSIADFAYKPGGPRFYRY
jgi:peptidoglycan hydrolase-like protein with peptidoglycan-binding domain